MKEFLQTYTRIVRSNCELISKTYDDFLKQFNEFTNEKLLEQFCLSKCTGREMPVINSCGKIMFFIHYICLILNIYHFG